MASTRSVTEITNHILQQAWPDSFLPVSSPRGYVISLAGTVFSVWPFVGVEVCSWRVMRASLREQLLEGGGPRVDRGIPRVLKRKDGFPGIPADRRQSVPSSPILRKLPVRSSGLLEACSVSWWWWPGFTGTATTTALPLKLWAPPRVRLLSGF